MPSRRLHRVVNPTTCATDTDHVTLNSGLRFQVLQSQIDVAWPLALSFLCLRRCGFLELDATTLPKAPIVQCQDVNARRCKLLRQSAPHFALPIALMQEQNSRSRSISTEVCCLERRTIRCGEIDSTLAGEC